MARISQKDLELLPENPLNEAIEALKFGLKFNSEYYDNDVLGLLKQSILNFHRFIELALKCFMGRRRWKKNM